MMMKLNDKQVGQPITPLETLTLITPDSQPGDQITVKDGAGHVYVSRAAQPDLTFTVCGALGCHVATLTDSSGAIRDELRFTVDAKTDLRDDRGFYQELLQMLYYSMLTEDHPEWSEVGYVRYQGRIYHFFVRWLRDHVHVMKGLKYFHGELRDTIDLYRDSQRADGMIFDNVYPRKGPHNYWEMRMSEGDFIRIFDDFSSEFRRMPVENDVEYLFVEGLYFTWKAVGDDAWMSGHLDAAIRALNYSMNDPLRWSEKYQLLKRGYTIDTWDFQSSDDTVKGDAIRIDADETRFGVMFGDNTGYAMACRYLAEMLERVGRTAEAEHFHARSQDILARVNQLSWNGDFYTHHVPEEDGLVRDFGVDEKTQVSLSNAYSINRNISHHQSSAIIRTYQRIREQLPVGSPGEWYTIYPPFERGFGNHGSKWQYMNGGVTTIVAGELAHGAFQHGYESYAVDILDRLYALGKRFNGLFQRAYTGSIPEDPPRDFTPIDLSPYANIDLAGEGGEGVAGWTGEGINDLRDFPVGQQTLAGIDWLITDPALNGRRACIGLRQDYAREVSIPIGQKAASIYFLHAISQAAQGIAGLITLHYDDGTVYQKYVVSGDNASNWWFPAAPDDDNVSMGGRKKITAVAWRGANRVCIDVGALAYGLDHPHPDKVIERISLQAAHNGAFWGVLGITLSAQPAYFGVNPISFGIPNSWGAAAVTYALIEGLAGVVDRDVLYQCAAIEPRWVSTGVNDIEVTVRYADSGGYVKYHYEHFPTLKRIRITLTGSGHRFDYHVMLPAKPISVAVDGQPVPFNGVQIESSEYVDFTLTQQSTVQQIEIQYA